jgi:hypothetical protein
MELEPKEAAVYIERTLALVKSVTSLPLRRQVNLIGKWYASGGRTKVAQPALNVM